MPCQNPPKDTPMKFAALLCTALVGAAPALAQDRIPNPLRYAVEGGYAPFSVLGADGRIKGFDIDIANALCERMKVQCVQVQSEFDAMIPGLRAKKFDAIVASMSITAERRKAVDFSENYYNTPARLLARADAKLDPTPEGLKGKRVGVQRTTIHDRYATATFKGAEIVRYTKQDEVFLDLVSGRIDASLVDSVAADIGFLKTGAGKGFALRGPNFDDPAYFGFGAGIAVRKGDAVLQAALNAALAALRADGSYKKINDRYFSFDAYGADPARPGAMAAAASSGPARK
jgi:arginine/ornithine transport system substrate-binding protein